MDDFNADTVYRLIDKQRPKFILRIGEYEMETIAVLKMGLGDIYMIKAGILYVDMI